MVLGLARRALGILAFLLVAYAFVTVPIGRRTGYGHLVAIFTTEPARQAAEDLHKTGVDFADRIAHGADRPGGKPARP